MVIVVLAGNQREVLNHVSRDPNGGDHAYVVASHTCRMNLMVGGSKENILPSPRGARFVAAVVVWHYNVEGGENSCIIRGSTHAVHRLGCVGRSDTTDKVRFDDGTRGHRHTHLEEIWFEGHSAYQELGVWLI